MRTVPTCADPTVGDLRPAGLAELRAALTSLADRVPDADGARVRELHQATVRCLEVTTGPEPRGSILYVHGGAFCLLRADPYAKMAGHLARATGYRVLLPDYRLPPEDPYPTPLLDVVAAYASLEPPFVLGGDSAGANRALAAVGLARELGLAVPALVVLFSPWLDLALGAPSVASNASVDTELDPATLASYARAYAGGIALDHPCVSPRRVGRLPFPPVLVLAGEDEILRDDAVAFAEDARSRGVDVTLEIAPRMQHNFPFWGPLVPEAMRAYETVAQRIARLEHA